MIYRGIVDFFLFIRSKVTQILMAQHHPTHDKLLTQLNQRRSGPSFVIEKKKKNSSLKFYEFPNVTLNDIMLNKDILPPEADMTKESFLDNAKQGTASSGLQLVKSLVINMPDVGCTK